MGDGNAVQTKQIRLIGLGCVHSLSFIFIGNVLGNVFTPTLSTISLPLRGEADGRIGLSTFDRLEGKYM